MIRNGTVYIVRVFYKQLNDARNMQTHNCDTLTQAWQIIDRLKTNNRVHKIELLSLLESFTLTVQ